MKQGATKEVKTDNSYFKDKVHLRKLGILSKGKDTISVLDAYSGDATIWRKVANDLPDLTINLTRIETKRDAKGVYLRGDNLKFIKNMDVSDYDCIDLDAYGIPYNQLKILFEKEYKGTVFITFIQSVLGRMNKGLLSELGFPPKMVDKIPTLFSANGLQKFKQYLAGHGVKKIQYITHQSKHYITAELT